MAKDSGFHYDRRYSTVPTWTPSVIGASCEEQPYFILMVIIAVIRARARGSGPAVLFSSALFSCVIDVQWKG